MPTLELPTRGLVNLTEQTEDWTACGLVNSRSDQLVDSVTNSLCCN